MRPTRSRSWFSRFAKWIRSIQGAHTALLDLEELEEEELNDIHAEYRRLAEGARAKLRRGRVDTGTPEVHLNR